MNDLAPAIGAAEQSYLPEMPDLAALLVSGGFPPAPGAWAWLERPGPDGAGDVALCAVPDAVWHPATGTVLDAQGQVLFSPSHQRRNPGAASSRARRSWIAKRIPRASLWLPPGGLRNYGHFLFDGLTGLGALDDAGLTAPFPPVAARLKGWQKDLLGAARLVSDTASGGGVAIGQAIYATTMNSYLNRAGTFAARLAERFGRGDPGAAQAIYLSRRGFSGRILVNEAKLETALAAKGVTVLRPERLSVDEQIDRARRAGILIGASGAALANQLFMAPGSTVIELRPERVGEPWMGLSAAALRLRHLVLPLAEVPAADAPLGARIRQLPRAATGRYRYCLRAEVDAVISALAVARG